MVLLFLQDGRSALIVMSPIPIFISGRAVAQLFRTVHQHHDPGGVALAVGVLVDGAR